MHQALELASKAGPGACPRRVWCIHLLVELRALRVRLGGGEGEHVAWRAHGCEGGSHGRRAGDEPPRVVHDFPSFQVIGEGLPRSEGGATSPSSARRRGGGSSSCSFARLACCFVCLFASLLCRRKLAAWRGDGSQPPHLAPSRRRRGPHVARGRRNTPFPPTKTKQPPFQ